MYAFLRDGQAVRLDPTIWCPVGVFKDAFATWCRAKGYPEHHNFSTAIHAGPFAHFGIRVDTGQTWGVYPRYPHPAGAGAARKKTIKIWGVDMCSYCL
eukprot:tig00000681_g3069.t1